MFLFTQIIFSFRAAIEKELLEFDEAEDGIEDNLWENASPGEVHERIRHHLIQNKFGQAISLLNAAKEEFPVFKNLENADEIVAGQLRTIFFMPLFREVAEKDEQVWQYPLWNFKLEGYKTRHRYKISKCSNSFPILRTDFRK